VILKLENYGILVVEAIGVIKKVKNKLDNMFCAIGIQSMKSLRKLLKRIPD